MSLGKGEWGSVSCWVSVESEDCCARGCGIRTGVDSWWLVQDCTDEWPALFQGTSYKSAGGRSSINLFLPTASHLVPGRSMRSRAERALLGGLAFFLLLMSGEGAKGGSHRER